MRGENFLERKLFSPHPFFKELNWETNYQIESGKLDEDFALQNQPKLFIIHYSLFILHYIFW